MCVCVCVCIRLVRVGARMVSLPLKIANAAVQVCCFGLSVMCFKTILFYIL